MSLVRVCGALGLAAASALLLAWSLRRKERRAVRDGRRRIMVVCTGSVAAVKAAELVRILIEDHQVFVDLVLTKSASFFQDVDYNGCKGRSLITRLQQMRSNDGSTPWLEVWLDEDEWRGYKNIGNGVVHIDLAKRNVVLLFAPLCANSLAQLVGGGASSLALSVARAWAYDLEETFALPIRKRCGDHVVQKPFIVAPAMNTLMWHQKVTQAHLSVLRDRGVIVLDPIEKVLACGDKGQGAMVDPKTIADAASRLLDAHEESAAQAKRGGCPDFLL
mmetsp:Transcript_74927/g.150653  ORF Transcript_74927/g.150653 Transcript_74927/m.150653 type:complete len:276 (+) Transcript_74927:42-869(+)